MARGRFQEMGSVDDAETGEDGSYEESAGVEMEGGQGRMVDLSGTDENLTYPVQKPGLYDAELIQMDFGQAQSSGNDMWTTVWELTDESLAYKGADGKMQQPRQWAHLSFSDGGRPRVKRFLARIKVDDDYNKELLNGRFDPEAVADEGRLIGAKAKLKVGIRRYQGQNRNNVLDILPPSNPSGGKGGAFANL